MGRGRSFLGKKNSQKWWESGELNTVDSLSKDLHPSRINTGKKYQSVQAAIDDFNSRHRNEKIEYGTLVGEQGYTWDYRQGKRNFVALDLYKVRSGKFKNATLVHNHPSGSTFSAQDLAVAGMTPNIKAIVAATGKKTYKFEKTKDFNFSQFRRAMSRFRISKGGLANYNKEVGEFLKKRQKKYGFIYTEE